MLYLQCIFKCWCSSITFAQIWGTSNLWYLVYLLELVLTAGVLIIFYWAPESPRYVP